MTSRLNYLFLSLTQVFFIDVLEFFESLAWRLLKIFNLLDTGGGGGGVPEGNKVAQLGGRDGVGGGGGVKNGLLKQNKGKNNFSV
jgi:hypothetical protein